MITPPKNHHMLVAKNTCSKLNSLRPLHNLKSAEFCAKVSLLFRVQIFYAKPLQSLQPYSRVFYLLVDDYHQGKPYLHRHR